METKGNPVDSVIQYQLHKKTSGEGGDSFKCAYSNETPLKIEPVFEKQYESVTQEDIDNDKYLRFINSEIGDNIVVYTTDITPQDILNNKIPFIIHKLDSSSQGATEINYSFLPFTDISLNTQDFESSLIFMLSGFNYKNGLLSDSLDNVFMMYQSGR